jgi:uncharacterized protein YcnI
MKELRTVRALAAAAALVALVVPASAFAHAKVSPPVALAKVSQVYTLAVPTEKENAVTTQVEMTPPSGFSIDSFVPSPGWTRKLQQTGSGDSAVITKVTWSGGHVPTGEDATFSFLGQPAAVKTYTFEVRQTYSDGSVVDWNGSESSDSPSPVVKAESSVGGGTSTLAIVALALAAIALIAAVVGLVARGGGRTLA